MEQVEQKSTSWLMESETVTERALSRLLREVEKYRALRGWSESYFSQKACGSDTAVKRLRESGAASVAIVKRIEVFMKASEVLK